MLHVHFPVNFVEHLVEIVVAEGALLAHGVVARCSDLVELLLRQVVLVGLLQLLPQTLPDLHECHFVPSGQAARLRLLAHVAERLDESLGSQLFLEELAALFAELHLLQGQEAVVSQVNLEAPLEHQECLHVKVLHQLLPSMVKELELHFERFLQ